MCPGSEASIGSPAPRGDVAANNMNEDKSQSNNSGNVGEPGRFSASDSASNETPEQQHVQSYPTPTQLPSVSTPNQSYKRSMSQDTVETLSPHSPTPFRPMQPREFSLGNSLRRLHPTMPLPILPADVSGMASNPRSNNGEVAPKSIPERVDSGDNWNDLKQKFTGKSLGVKQEDTQTQGNGDETGNFSYVVTTKTSSSGCARRSSMYSNAMSSISMGVIEEEGSNTGSGMSRSGLSASLLALDKASEDADNAMDNTLDDYPVIKIHGEPRPHLMAPPQCSVESAVKDVRHRKEDSCEEVLKGSSDIVDLSQTASRALDDGEVSDDHPMTMREKFEILSTTSPLNIEKEKSKSVTSSEDDQSSSESDISFLSWDQSRRSGEYIQALNKTANSCSLPQQDSSMPTTSNKPNPLEQNQQTYPEQLSSLPTKTQPYSRSSTQETSDTISSHSPTPFRPMLPRELLLWNNSRRVNLDIPLPTLPADVSPSIKKRSGGGQRNVTPQEGS